LLLARTYSGVPSGPSSDWSGDGISLLTKEKVQNEAMKEPVRYGDAAFVPATRFLRLRAFRPKPR
jgi:hypothetical protein